MIHHHGEQMYLHVNAAGCHLILPFLHYFLFFRGFNCRMGATVPLHSDRVSRASRVNQGSAPSLLGWLVVD